jgi:hypothetical protein
MQEQKTSKMKEKIASVLTGRRLMVVASFLGLFLLSVGVSWALFSYLIEEPETVSQDLVGGRARIDPTLPKTEECPINGQMFSEPERAIWEERRPMAAIIENHKDARPLSGLSKADVVYEAVAEGGVTRFLAVFYCGVSAHDMKVAVIRSARVYYIDWASEYGDSPIFLHWGGANNICKDCPGGVKTWGTVAPQVDAYRLLNKIGWYGGQAGNDFNGGTNIGHPAVVRILDRLETGQQAAAEHQPVAYLDKVFDVASERGFGYEDENGNAWDENYVSWKFADDEPADSPNAVEISFKFWDGMEDYDVAWKYDPSNNRYLRSNGGEPFVDWEFENEQVVAKNVVIQFVLERGPVDKEKHLFYTTTGSGKALVFKNGEVVEGTWKKKLQNSRTVFYDEEGDEINFVRGPIWIEVVPKGNEIDY